MIAWRTGDSTNTFIDSKRKKQMEVFTNIQQGFNDNGEKGAGSKMLEQVLIQNNIMNVLLIATRWYGGNPIGSLRFRHITQASFESIKTNSDIHLPH